jgi:hypothetical protein
MKKINLFLRFTDEAEWRTYATTTDILTQVEQFVIDEDGNETNEVETVDQWSYFTHDYAIFNIGTIYNNDGVYDEETGEIITPATAKDGWHVNWKAASFPAGIEAYEVMPVNVCQVWSGDPVEFNLRTAARTTTAAVFAT